MFALTLLCCVHIFENRFHIFRSVSRCTTRTLYGQRIVAASTDLCHQALNCFWPAGKAERRQLLCGSFFHIDADTASTLTAKPLFSQDVSQQSGFVYEGIV